MVRFVIFSLLLVQSFKKSSLSGTQMNLVLEVDMVFALWRFNVRIVDPLAMYNGDILNG